MRFKEFDGEWEGKRLGELVDFKVTNSFSRDNLNYENGSVKNIHYGDIHTKFRTLFDIAKENVPFINEEISIGKISEDNYCKEGDIIFADASEDLNDVGKSIEIVSLHNNKLLSGLHTLLARPRNNIFHKGFNGYLFKSNSIRLQIKKEAQGTKVLSLSVARVSKIEISYPKISEQNKIASFMALLDERIYTQNKIIEELKLLMNNFSKQIFTQKLRFNDINGKSFPNWNKRKLGEIGKTYNGLTGKTKESFGSGKPYIQYMQIFEDSKIDISRFGFVQVNQGEAQNRVLFGDIFFTVSSETSIDIGTASVLLDEVDELYLNSFCFGFRANSLETLNPYFARYLFRSVPFRNDVVKLAQGSTRYNMSKVQLMKLNIFLPCAKEQIKIANFLTALDEKIKIEKKLLQQYEDQKKHLLQNMFI